MGRAATGRYHPTLSWRLLGSRTLERDRSTTDDAAGFPLRQAQVLAYAPHLAGRTPPSTRARRSNRPLGIRGGIAGISWRLLTLYRRPWSDWFAPMFSGF